MPVKGSSKMPISGVKNVNTQKRRAINKSVTKANLGEQHAVLFDLKRLVSQMYEIAAEMKKIAMFIKSADFPITPLYV